MLLHLDQNTCRHLNSVTHEGKVIVVATDADGGLWYTVKQDGFEDSYLSTPESQRTGWENWQALTFPNERDDASVLQKERVELTYEEDNSRFIMRSRYKTQNATAVAPVQLVSALGHVYVFRQSKHNTLLVDRFVLDGMTNRLNRKLDVRFKRSQQKYQPSQMMRKGSNGLENVDSLDFRDANNNYFYEPTTELCLINNLNQGWFAVVLVPTVEHDVHRWHIFAYNQETERVELTTIRASQEGLFDVKDYTYFEEFNETLVPQHIPGVIRRSLNIAEATVTNGLAATKYNLQEAGVTQSGEEQLQRTAARIMLAIPTNGGTAVFSFAIAGDGTLSKISESPKIPGEFPKKPLLRGHQREVLLPLNTLDEIKAYGDKTPPPKGLIIGMSEGTEADGEGLMKITTGGQVAELQRGDLVKIKDTRNYQGLYCVAKISNDIFEIDLSMKELGYWEKEEPETGGLTFDGMITAYRKNGNGKLQITCPNHGLESNDSVQIKGTEDCNQTYTVRKVDATNFVVEHQWTGGEAINVKLLSQKRRGLVFDGAGDYVEIPYNAQLNPNSFSVSCWVKVEGKQGTERSLISCADDTGGIKRGYRIVANDQNQWLLQVGRESSWQTITGPNIQLNTWTHICGTYDVTNDGVKDVIRLNLYVDGVLAQTRELQTRYAPNASCPLRIGATAGTPTSFFHGRIADVQIWNIARPASDIEDTMHLQLTGREARLIGYWRLGAISEGKVTDFSANCNHGSVHGDPYVSAATLERTLADKATQVIKYTNPELFAVTKHATYEESFEFKVNSSTPVDPNNIESNKIFTFSYWGKSSRSAEDEKPVDKRYIQPCELFETLDGGWFKASCKITVPSQISLLRSFEIADVKGDWNSLEIRKHRVRLLSDSITQETYEDEVDLQPEITKKTNERNQANANIAALTRSIAANQPKKAKFYQHSGYRSLLAELGIGIYRADMHAWIRAGISSLEVPDEWQVTLWSGPNFDGERRIVGPGKLSQLRDFNDRTQSISVESTNSIVNLDAERERELRRQEESLRSLQTSLSVLELDLKNLQKLESSQAENARLLQQLANKEQEYAVKSLQKRQLDYEIELLESNQLASEITRKTNEKNQANQIITTLTTSIAVRQSKITSASSLRVGFYKDEQLKYHFQDIGIGWYSADNYWWIREGISSVSVNDGLKVTLYSERQFAGDSYEIIGPSRQGKLGHFNDRTQSIKIESTQINYSGELELLRQEEQNLTSLRTSLSVLENEILDLTSLQASAATELQQKKNARNLISSQITEVKAALVSSNQGLNRPLSRSEPYRMHEIGKDNRGLVTMGAHLKFVNPSSRLNAIETCEGNVQLSYFDAQGRMQQTNYDATSDSRNTSFEQWINNAQRACLNLSASNSIASLERPLDPATWTLEAQFFYPLPDGANIQRNTLVSGQGRQESMRFDGVDDHITLPNLNHNFSGGITVEAWVWYDSFKNFSRIIDFGNGASNDNILFANERSSGNLLFFVGRGRNSPQQIIATGALETGKWMHLAATIDALGNAKLYKNGIEIASGSVNLPSNVNRTSNYIGQSNWAANGYFHGRISDLRIWNKARTQVEIQTDMVRRLTGRESYLVNYWQLNEITTQNSSSEVRDLSSSSHNGTVKGAILNTEICSQDVVVERDGTIDRLGVYIAGLGFIGSGYLMNQLSPGWHHIGVVAQAETDQPTTIFYIDGEKVGELKTGAISTIAAIGNSNSQQKGCPFGKLAEVRIWEIALSQNEVAINSKTLLSGNEPGLLAYYPMTEAQGATIRDRTGSGNDGTISGGGNENTVDQHWWGCSAPIGNPGTTVMRFDGQDNYIEVPFNQNLNPNQFTVSGWAKVTGGQGTWRSLLASRNANTTQCQGYILYAGQDNKWQAWVGNGTSWVDVIGPDVEWNVWTHVCATYDGSKLTLYINGNKFSEKTTSYTSNSNRPLRIGAGTTENTPSLFFSGRISEVCIWNRACTQAEIQQGMYVPLSGKELNLVGYYPLNYIRSEGTARIALNLAIPDALLFGATVIDEKLLFSKPKVMQFDGQDDYVSCPNPNPDFSQAITIEAWVWYDSFKYWSRIIDFGNGAGSDNIVLANEGTSNNLAFTVFRGSLSQRIIATGVLETGKWMHLAATIDASGNAKLYKNGIQVQSGSVHLPNNLDRTNNFIGKSNWTQDGYFHGRLSNVCIWNKACTQVEIRKGMDTPWTGREPNLVACYPLSEIRLEGTSQKTPNLVGSARSTYKGTVSGTTEVEDFGLSLTRDAVVSEEYSTITIEPGTERKVAIMRRFFAYPTTSGAVLLPDKRVEALELRWIGNAQFAPTLLGYVEGPPPVPSENLTLSDDYNKATSVELTMSEDVAFKWNRSQDVGGGTNTELFLGAEKEVTVFGPLIEKIAQKRVGFKGNSEFKSQERRETSITASSSLTMVDKLELRGTPEQKAKFGHLGKRFIPKNVGYALVISALADVFVTRLARSGKMVSYLVQPVDGIDPDINTITFLINPAYTMNGSLDGLTGSSATSDRFFRHVPEMRAQYGSLYPASYYRLKEAYDLKQQIEKEDTRRASYFKNFDVRGVDEISLERSIGSGQNVASIGVQREEDKADPTTGTQDKQDAATAKAQQFQREAEDTAVTTGRVAEAKRAQIQTEIDNREKRAHATARFANWQKRMDDILGKAGKRNIVNTYVWDADGGLRIEAQSFASTIEHMVGSSFEMSAALGFEGQFGLSVFRKELTTQATVNLTQTMTKTETRSKGFQLNISVDGLEARGITDHNDNPIMPGEKVDRYRFMSFYLEGSSQNFQDFFNYVVDPEWLASNDEEARALREARSKPNNTWRVLHRVTYVERPALMDFGRDVRQLLRPTEESEIAQLKAQIEEMKEQNQEIANQLTTILQLLQDRNRESTAT